MGQAPPLHPAPPPPPQSPVKFNIVKGGAMKISKSLKQCTRGVFSRAVMDEKW